MKDPSGFVLQPLLHGLFDLALSFHLPLQLSWKFTDTTCEDNALGNAEGWAVTPAVH